MVGSVVEPFGCFNISRSSKVVLTKWSILKEASCLRVLKMGTVVLEMKLKLMSL